MLQGWGRRTSPRTLSSSLVGSARIKCNLAHHALLAPGDAVPRELAPAGTSVRIPPVADKTPIPAKPLAGPITPLKLARLSELLRLPVTRVETILQESPAAVRHLEPEQIAQRLQELCSTLGVSPKQAAFLVAKQPGYMLLTPLPDMRSKVRELAEVLGVPQAAVIRTALTAPSILRRSTTFIERRVKTYSALLRCSPVDVLHVLARGPEYLSDTPSSVRQRMTALGCVLRRPRCTIAAMLQARPDLVFMSGKVMNTKVNGLMCILNKQKHHVVTLIVKLPELLRCNLDCVRNAFKGLQALLGKREGFVYAMVCHAPSLLLLTPRSLHQRCTAVRRCLVASPEWCEQFGQLRPPGVAQLVLNRRGSLSAMMYLAQRRRAGVVSLEQLLCPGPDGGPAAALGEAWPDFMEWMERRRQHATLRNRQQRGQQQPVEQLSEEQLPEALQKQQQEQQQERQKQRAVVPADAIAPRLPPPGAVVNGVSSHLAGGSLMHHSQPGIAQTIGQGSSPNQSAGDAVAFEQGCSNSSASVGSSSSNSNNINGSSRCLGQARERHMQDGESGVRTDRSQQPDASTSGRQPSWLQLQADYRRSLQLRAPRKRSFALQQGRRDGGRAPAESGLSQVAEGLGSRGRARPESLTLTVSSACAERDASLIGAGGARLGIRGSVDDGEATPTLTGQLMAGTVLRLSRQQLQSPGLLGSGGSDAGRAGVEQLPGATLDAGGSEVALAGASTPGHVAGHSVDLLQSDMLFDIHVANKADGERHRHSLGDLLKTKRRRKVPGDMGSAPGRPDSRRSPSVGAELADSAADTSLATSAHAVRLGVSLGSQALQHSDANWGVSTAGELASSLSNRQGETWTGEAASGDGGGRAGSSHLHAVDPEPRGIPVWLRLDATGVRSAAGVTAHASESEGGYASERARQGESEGHSSGRPGGAPPADAPQHGDTDEVVVVNGDGCIRDIKGLGRDSHTRSLRGQDPGGPLSLGQTQKLESALEAIVPR